MEATFRSDNFNESRSPLALFVRFPASGRGAQPSTNMPSGVWTDLDYVLNGNGGQMLAFDPTGITTAKQYRILIK